MVEPTKGSDKQPLNSLPGDIIEKNSTGGDMHGYEQNVHHTNADDQWKDK
jgi:hypothetical protein